MTPPAAHAAAVGLVHVNLNDREARSATDTAVARPTSPDRTMQTSGVHATIPGAQVPASKGTALEGTVA